MNISLSFATMLNSKLKLNERIEFLHNFEIDGIELFVDDLLIEPLKESTISILNEYPENSIHMPNLGNYDGSPECEAMINTIIEKAHLFRV